MGVVRLSRPRAYPLLRFGSLGLGLAVLAVGLAGPFGGASGAGHLTPAVIPTGTVLAANLTINGAPTIGATSASNAITVSLATPLQFNFSWTGRGGKFAVPTAVPVQTARLEFKFLGEVVFTKDQVSSNPFATVSGSMTSSLDLGGDRYLVEGVYLLKASLLTSDGSVGWSQAVYLRFTAAYHLTAVNLGLGGLVVAELYSIATIGSAKGAAAAAATPSTRRGGP